MLFTAVYISSRNVSGSEIMLYESVKARKVKYTQKIRSKRTYRDNFNAIDITTGKKKFPQELYSNNMCAKV